MFRQVLPEVLFKQTVSVVLPASNDRITSTDLPAPTTKRVAKEGRQSPVDIRAIRPLGLQWVVVRAVRGAESFDGLWSYVYSGIVAE